MRASGDGSLGALVLPDLLDGLRGRRQLLIRAVTPLALFAAVLAVSLVSGGDRTATGDQRFTVAVEGDLAGAAGTLAGLGGERIDFVATDDAALAVVEEADAAVRVPPDLDARLASGSDATIELVEVTVDAESRAAVAQMDFFVVDRARREALAAAGLDAEAVAFTIDLTSVELTPGGTRVLGAELVAAVVALQSALLVSGAANRFRGRRGGGLLLAQLALPLARSRLAVAKGVAELTVGTIAGLPVLIPVLVLAVITSGREGGAPAAVAAVPAVLAAVAVLGACTTSLGVLVGAAARSPEQVTLGSGAAVVVAAIVAATVGLGDVPRPPAIAAVPLAGVVAELRQLLSGAARPAGFVVALCVSMVFALVVSIISGRVLDGERLVVREA